MIGQTDYLGFCFTIFSWKPLNRPLYMYVYLCVENLVFHPDSVEDSYCLTSFICLAVCWYGIFSVPRVLLMPASLILFIGLVPKPSRKMAKTWDQKQTRSRPFCFKQATRQQSRDLTAGHVPAAFCHFPAAEPNFFQTMEPSLPFASCKHLYVFI